MIKRHDLKAITITCISAFFMYGCVDNTYDINEDIDMTMGLGSSGLGLKIGSSSKTYLKDILKVEDSDMLHTLSTGTPMYYLLKDGSVSTKYEVASLKSFKIDDFNLITKGKKFDGVPSGTLPQAYTINDFNVEGSTSMSFDINEIPKEVKSIKKIGFENVNIVIDFNVLRNGSSKWNGLNITKSDLTFTFPEYMHLKTGQAQKNIFRTNSTGQIVIPVDYIEFDSEQSEFGKIVNDGRINVPSQDINVEGLIDVTLDKGTVYNSSDYANVAFAISISPIMPKSVSGQVDPDINPDIEPINISSDLPDFLNDEAVVLNVSNPTIRFDVNGKDLPVNLNFSADVTGYNTVRLPSTRIEKNRDSKFYFYQGSSPFDPDGVGETDVKVEVPSLSSIITKIPSQISINAKDGKIKTDLSELHTIDLPFSCNLGLDYKVLVPFKFNKDLCIVYNDSVCDMAKDLKDYDADGIEITTDAESSIPLGLKVEVTAYDVNDNLIPSSELVIENAIIDAAPLTGGIKTTNLSVSLIPTQRGVVNRIDKIKFKVTADSKIEGEGILTSDQYIQMNNLRLRLKGQIIGNFNKKDN